MRQMQFRSSIKCKLWPYFSLVCIKATKEQPEEWIGAKNFQEGEKL